MLVVSRAEISDADSSGISRGRWFADWPKDRIAQIYSFPSASKEPFCPIRYEFGADDRQFGNLFARTKRSSFGTAFRQQSIQHSADAWLKRKLRGIKCSTIDSLVKTGLWELLFWTRPSQRMTEWCLQFKPDLIYTTCTDLSYIELSLYLKSALNIPMSLQVDDDWLGTLYTKGLSAHFLRPFVEKKINRLLSDSSVCLSTGPLMSGEYMRRYGKHFESIYLCDDFRRFDEAPSIRSDPSSRFVIVYSGSLYLGRWKGLLDLHSAISQGSLANEDILIKVYTGHIPLEAGEAFASCNRMQIFPGLSDSQVPGVLKGADMLFLPESFEAKYQDYIRFSISSKAHIYMMSGRPIIVYGPSGMSVIEYARDEGWALVVDRRDLRGLGAAIQNIRRDKSYSIEILQKARTVAEKNHNAEKVRNHFKNNLRKCANRQ
ncbi:MAG: glycosyltransferase family 4 protein [Verrucomicrobia bacterium]|nr:MAG: glycosyltransferase family 4 protein [Verrucomicrobiota bacterium]